MKTMYMLHLLQYRECKIDPVEVVRETDATVWVKVDRARGIHSSKFLKHSTNYQFFEDRVEALREALMVMDERAERLREKAASAERRVEQLEEEIDNL